jgi:hypothetical protein
MRLIFWIGIAMLACAGGAQAGGEWRGDEQLVTPERPYLYAKGCYWHRGVRYCSSYCYVEINGKHYCRQRESEAYPQGDPYAQGRPTVEQIYRQPRGYR